MDKPNWQRFGFGCMAFSVAAGGAMVKAELIHHWFTLGLSAAVGLIVLLTVKTQ